MRAYRDALHRLRERHTFRNRDDPDAAWRCCEFWQRTLLNKWNSREFAAKHGCRIPALYWRGYAPSVRRLASLPGHFVIRPVWGTVRNDVFVVADGRDLLRGQSASPAEIRKCLRRSPTLDWAVPILAEEFVKTEDGRYRLPIEYKCHTFGDTVAAVELIERRSARRGELRFYTPGWEPFPDPMDIGLPQAELTSPPPCLEEMLRCAQRLGTSVSTYVRIDFFSTDRGCVFNEFSSTPRKGASCTPYCDEIFGALWAEKFPHAT